MSLIALGGSRGGAGSFERGTPVILYELKIRLKPFWQRSLLSELFHITSKEHAVYCQKGFPFGIKLTTPCRSLGLAKFLESSLELIDIKVYEPEVRALLGTACNSAK